VREFRAAPFEFRVTDDPFDKTNIGDVESYRHATLCMAAMRMVQRNMAGQGQYGAIALLAPQALLNR